MNYTQLKIKENSDDLTRKWGMQDSRANYAIDQTSKRILATAQSGWNKLSAQSQKYFRELGDYVSKFESGKVTSIKEYYR